MSQSKQSRLREKQRREAWKKRRHANAGVAALPEKPSESFIADVKASVSQRFGPVDRVVTSAELGIPKISDRLMELVEPYWEETPTENARKNVMAVGAVAWNIAVVPEDKRAELTFSMLGKLVPEFERVMSRQPDMITKSDIDNALRAIDRESAEAAQVFLGLVLTLVERKLLLFPNDGRLIIDHFYTGTGKNTTLQVVSSVPDDAVR